MPCGVAGFPPVKLAPPKRNCAFGMLPTVRPSAEGKVKLKEVNKAVSAKLGSEPMVAGSHTAVPENASPGWTTPTPVVEHPAGPGGLGGHFEPMVPENVSNTGLALAHESAVNSKTGSAEYRMRMCVLRIQPGFPFWLPGPTKCTPVCLFWSR